MTAAAPPLAALNGCRVLVVEDEFFQAKDLARALSEAGAVSDQAPPRRLCAYIEDIRSITSEVSLP